MNYGSAAPDYFFEIPVNEHKGRVEMNDDLCIIDDKYFFIRGNIEIPIIDTNQKFIWDVWVSLSEENFDKINDFWEMNFYNNLNYENTYEKVMKLFN